MGKKGEFISAILKRAQDLHGRKRLTCANALELAKEFGTEAMEIGRICNRNNIKICKCQLGCFK